MNEDDKVELLEQITDQQIKSTNWILKEVSNELNRLDRTLFWQILILWVTIIVLVFITSTKIAQMEDKRAELERRLTCVETPAECYDPYD